jgi:endonuclease VIII
MPEGHTLHRLALDHRKALVGRRVRVSSPQGRFEAGALAVDGRVLTSVEARGKHLFYGFEGGGLVHVHLGLFGRFRRHRQPAPAPRGQVRMRLETDAICVDLHGPTACELLDRGEYARLVERLGPDLLGQDADPQPAWERVRRSKRAIGALLLDQSVMSGVGNVYRAEGLFVTGIHPETQGRTLQQAEFLALWRTLVEMLEAGVRDRRIVTVPHPELRPGRRPPRGERTWVYGQRRCRRCRGEIARWSLGARTIYACDACQPRRPAARPGQAPARAKGAAAPGGTGDLSAASSHQ